MVGLPFYNEDILHKNLSLKDDIIMGKLCSIENYFGVKELTLLKKLLKRKFFPLLDTWLIKLRIEVLTGSNQIDKVKFIENLAEAKNLLISTNVNTRLVLENLFLKI